MWTPWKINPTNLEKLVVFLQILEIWVDFRAFIQSYFSHYVLRWSQKTICSPCWELDKNGNKSVVLPNQILSWQCWSHQIESEILLTLWLDVQREQSELTKDFCSSVHKLNYKQETFSQPIVGILGFAVSNPSFAAPEWEGPHDLW